MPLVVQSSAWWTAKTNQICPIGPFVLHIIFRKLLKSVTQLVVAFMALFSWFMIRLFDSLVDWSFDWFDSKMFWLIWFAWLSEWFDLVWFAWLIEWVIVWLIDWLIALLIAWLFDCLIHQLLKWLTDQSRIDRPTKTADRQTGTMVQFRLMTSYGCIFYHHSISSVLMVYIIYHYRDIGRFFDQMCKLDLCVVLYPAQAAILGHCIVIGILVCL